MKLPEGLDDNAQVITVSCPPNTFNTTPRRLLKKKISVLKTQFLWEILWILTEKACLVVLNYITPDT